MSMSSRASGPLAVRSATGLGAMGARLVRFWSSVKLGVVLMLAIAAASIIGTVVPQGDPAAIERLRMSDGIKHALTFIGAQNVYYSAWFMTLLALFFLNLLVSTLVTVIPRLKVALRKPPEVSVSVQERHHDNKVYLPAQAIETVAATLKQHGYRVYRARNGGVVSHKGRWSRFSPLVTHIGLFVVLLGGICSGLTVFKVQVPLFKGETIPAGQIVQKLAGTRGALARDRYPWRVRLDDFRIAYQGDNFVKQYYSHLSILEGDKVVAQQTIWVNEPLVYDGVWLYQAFWGVGAVNLSVNGHPRRIDLQSGSSLGLKGYLSQPSGSGGDRYFFYLASEKAPLLIMRLAAGQRRPLPVATLELGKQTELAGSAVRYDGPVLFSGLQAKSDPGIPLVYTGFVIVMLGTALAFFSLRQVWVGPLDSGYLVSGKANRGHQAFGQELVRIATKLGARNELPHGS